MSVKALRLLAACSSIACACGGSTSASSGPGDGAADSPSDGGGPGADAGAEAAGNDAAPAADGPGEASQADAPVVDAGDLPSTLEGIWLIGWVGNVNHYSWVRFDSLQGGGMADYLPGTNLTANTPYWTCSGAGSWGLTQKPQTVMLTFPASCNAQPLVLTFDSFKPHSGYPMGATLDASVTVDGTGQTLNGWKFPSSQCDAAMTSCNNPF